MEIIFEGICVVNLGPVSKWCMKFKDGVVIFDFPDLGLTIRDSRLAVCQAAQDYLESTEETFEEDVVRLMNAAFVPAKAKVYRNGKKVFVELFDNRGRKPPTGYFALTYSGGSDLAEMVNLDWHFEMLAEPQNSEIKKIIDEVFPRTTDDNFSEEFWVAYFKAMWP